jgi:hypothetical protein
MIFFHPTFAEQPAGKSKPSFNVDISASLLLLVHIIDAASVVVVDVLDSVVAGEF